MSGRPKEFEFEDFFQALGDRTRLRLLNCIPPGKHTVTAWTVS
jgi:hypothetical protein